MNKRHSTGGIEVLLGGLLVVVGLAIAYVVGVTVVIWALNVIGLTVTYSLTSYTAIVILFWLGCWICRGD